VYTPCSIPDAQAKEKDRVRKYVLEIEKGEILRQDSIPFHLAN
jgi:hypothetical protein